MERAHAALYASRQSARDGGRAGGTMHDASDWQRWSRRRVSRRAVLRAGLVGGIGAAGLALVGCGGDDDATAPPDVSASPDAPAAADATDQDSSVAAAHERPATPVAGGVAQLYSRHDLHDRWDPHRSRARQTQIFHSLMYNRLVRWDSISGGTLEGDLANLPEQPDAVTYIFRLRPEAKFWDQEPTRGRGVRADDIRINLERQIEGLDAADDPDPLFFRQGDYLRTADIAVQDLRTLTLRTATPDVTYLGAVHAGPWAWITSPEAIVEYGDRWRDEGQNVLLNSGTGPYVPVSFDPAGDLVLRRSSNWWKPNSAYADGWIFRHTATADVENRYRAGELDMADFPLATPAVEGLREAFPEHLAFEIPIDTPVVLALVSTEDPDNPLRDPRLVRALGLAMDRYEMIERLYFGDGRVSGPVPWFFPDWALAEDTLIQKPGYRLDKAADLPEISDLVDAATSAAGGKANFPAIPVVVPDLFEATFPGIAETVRAMLERNTGLTITTRFAPYAEIEQGLLGGTLPAFFGWAPTSLTQQEADPTAIWLQTARSGAPLNWGHYANPELDALLDDMQATADTTARRAQARDVQERLLAEPYWIQPVASGIQLGIAWPYLVLDPRSLDFAWSAHHLATAWLDTEHPAYPSSRTLPAADSASPASPSDSPSGE